MKVSKKAKLIKRVQTMELNNPIIQTLIGLVVFYIGLKMFSGGMKAMGNIDHLQWFLGNPIYMFVGGIVMTLLWQSSSLSTTAIIGLVAGGALPLPAVYVGKWAFMCRLRWAEHSAGRHPALSSRSSS